MAFGSHAAGQEPEFLVGVCIFFLDLAPNNSTNCGIQFRELKAAEVKKQHKYE